MHPPFKSSSKTNRAPARTSAPIKRIATVGALALASTLSFVSPASAATDIRGTESWSTDKLLMSLCTGSTSKTYWWINVNTGQVSKDTTNGLPAKSLQSGLERFEGSCYYPQSSTWTWTGSETGVTEPLVNCAYGSGLSQTVQANGSTTSTTTNSVSGSIGIDWTILEKVLSVQAGASYEHSWSYAKQSGWSVSTTLTVNPRRTGWLVLRPEMRTVRSNPVFHVDKYSWGKSGGGQENTTTWRGRSYNEISSRGAYYDAKANVLNSQGKPSGKYVAYDRAVNSSDCRN
ncbi:hypothetical protein OH768_08180 [Streptomyces sp. NBC_01622]|uniref:hypothetical protein n=1 Tax=Streptomyces sp. NBC_01622 TaxID=2975903 RepID=UPI003866B650|nr:hypothetical protein OH768_08180 [Streptomyces sp. NBC_01622]